VSSFEQLIATHIQAVTGIDPELRPATKPEFGHYQTNVALRLAKTAGKPPREVATELVGQLDLADTCEPPEIAGPGFINLRIKADVLAQAATQVLQAEQAGLPKADQPQVVVIDYSSPNVAKQMHVGHLRSTVIGDCFRRIFLALGHTVIAQNHLGDWGRQFGMLVEQIRYEGLNISTLDLPGAEALYLRANQHLKESAEFAEQARERVVLLQAGDAETKRIWQALIDVSLTGFNATYQRMGILLGNADVAGESSYNDDLPVIAADLEQRGIAQMDAGALVVFVDGDATPAIIRNSQGGYGYTCTDLAAIRRRVNEMHADRLIYVVGTPQAHHFAQLFAVARQAGYLPDEVVTEHAGFGQVLGKDGKRFATREGTAVPLNELLDAAEEHAAPAVALAAIKYADLSSQLQKDYVYDIERMVATTGDTGPYLQYAHARTCAVMRNAVEQGVEYAAVTQVAAPEEQTLALLLSRFGETVSLVAETLQPHRLCGYLFELASAFSSFYENCPILKSEPEIRASRLALTAAVRQVLATGLDLLGITAPERM
jgi:arginyl-tRNA synthetase